jgi:hypothetical protein
VTGLGLVVSKNINTGNCHVVLYQATTILKEVAGATRTALGSTNSDNTDQLGNKVTTSIKNQAVNKTEGLLNNSVNEFLNAFGAGRSEVSIGGNTGNCHVVLYQ